MDIGSKKVLAIIPAFNESGNIQKTLLELRQLQMPLTLVVIDDGSLDATAQEAGQAGAMVIPLPCNVGIGGAVQTGFQYALREGFDFAVQVDGDGQHDPAYIETILEPVVSGEKDIVVGSRFLPPFLGYRSSFVRRIGIHFFARLISLLTGFRVTDPTSGFRAFNKKMIRICAEYYPTDFPEPEIIMVAKRVGARFQEVPVEMRKRLRGHSSIRYLKTFYYMIKVTFAILLDTLKEERLAKLWEQKF